MKRSFPVIVSLIFAIFISPGIVLGEVRLPSIFNNNMVLQQNTEAAIWGLASKNSNVKITTSWNRRSYSARSGNDGRWKIKIATPSAGGPYEIIISDGKTLKLSNVLIGEVWVCSGQSNMEMPLRGYTGQPVINSNEDIAASSNPQIRLFTVTKGQTFFLLMISPEHGRTASLKLLQNSVLQHITSALC